MALYNPILGDIPQPQPNKENVFNPLIPNSNYKALTTTPLINELFATVLSNNDNQTSTYTTTREIVLTQVSIQTFFQAGSTGGISTITVYIGAQAIYSGSCLVNTTVESKEQDYNIPLNHVRIPANTKFRVITTTTEPTTSNYISSTSFIGYVSNKQ